MRGIQLCSAVTLVLLGLVACSSESTDAERHNPPIIEEPDSGPMASSIDTDYPETWEEKTNGQTRDEMIQNNREDIFEVMQEHGANGDHEENYTLDDFPIIDVVDGADSARVQVECMKEQGFEGTAYANGTYLYERIPADQGNAQFLAHYSCVLQYPVDPMQIGPLPRQEIVTLYAYYTGPLTTCLEGHGVPVDEPPTQDTWVDDYITGKQSWDPYAAFWRQNTEASFDAVNELYGACPQFPANFWPN